MSTTAAVLTPNTNKLSIYLVKEEILNPDDATKYVAGGSIKRKEIASIGFLYFRASNDYTPDWVEKFFGQTLLQEERAVFRNSSSSALLIVPVKFGKKQRMFAVPFGAGKHLLKDGCIVERFGLKTMLNVAQADGLRSLEKRTLNLNPKLSNEQISKASGADDFQIDYEKDLVNSVTGYCSVDDFGKLVTGKDALHVSCKTDITNIVPFLKDCWKRYNKDDYKKAFEWIDHIQELKSLTQRDKLTDDLIAKINVNPQNAWLAPPEIIDWSDIEGFKYSSRKGDKLFPDLDLNDYLDEASLNGKLTLAELDKAEVTCWSTSKNEIAKGWSLFKCLNANLKNGKKEFLLDNGKWYEINKDFVAQVEASFSKIEWTTLLGLPDYSHADEGAYNTDAATSVTGCCLDAKNLTYGGGRSKVEFCDIVTKSKKLLYVKRYSGSATLSHLFAQGFVSADLLLNDQTFRQAVNGILPAGYKNVVTAKPIKPRDYCLIYVLITKGRKKVSIPFFSKVNLKNVHRTLSNNGFKVQLCQVKTK